MYQFCRKLLFKLDAEKAHDISLTSLKWLEMSGLLSLLLPKPLYKPVEVMGLTFPNAIGLAAGLDKNADYLEGLARLGFGFVEVGTVTPRPQPGNTKPRLFRLEQAEAIINRMGFNNKGVDHLLEQVQIADTPALIGINIGKNFDTPIEKAIDDYLIGFNKVYAHADYVTINISSPNTPGLRTLQFGAALDQLLEMLKQAQAAQHATHQRYVPMAVKVAPDLQPEELLQLADTFTRYQVDAVIATNTTLDRDAVMGMQNSDQAGGLSGRPLFAKSTEIVRQFRQALPVDMPIIAAGGIASAEDAQQKIDAGAQLVQIYSGLIYKGPALINNIANTLQVRN